MNRPMGNMAGYFPANMRSASPRKTSATGFTVPSPMASPRASAGVAMRDPRVNMRKAADGGAMMKYANGGKVITRKPNGKPC